MWAGGRIKNQVWSQHRPKCVWLIELQTDLRGDWNFTITEKRRPFHSVLNVNAGPSGAFYMIVDCKTSIFAKVCLKLVAGPGCAHHMSLMLHSPWVIYCSLVSSHKPRQGHRDMLNTIYKQCQTLLFFYNVTTTGRQFSVALTRGQLQWQLKAFHFASLYS